MKDFSTYLVETADRCIDLARAGVKLAKELETISNIDSERQRLAANIRDVAQEVERIGQELLAKAVEIDTARQKANPGTFGP